MSGLCLQHVLLSARGQKESLNTGSVEQTDLIFVYASFYLVREAQNVFKKCFTRCCFRFGSICTWANLGPEHSFQMNFLKGDLVKQVSKNPPTQAQNKEAYNLVRIWGSSVWALAPVNCILSTVALILMRWPTEQQQQLKTTLTHHCQISTTGQLPQQPCHQGRRNVWLEFRTSGAPGVPVSWHGGVAPLLTKHSHMGIKPKAQTPFTWH